MKQETNRTTLLGLINISFDYPFQLRCPPVMYPIKLESGESGFVRIEHKDGLIICDKGKTTEDTEAEIRTVREKVLETKVKIILERGSVNYIEADENGNVIYPKYFTKVEVILAIPDLDTALSREDRREELEKLCKNIFQRFLFSYMYAVNDFAIELSSKNLWPTQTRFKRYPYTQDDLDFLTKNPGFKGLMDRFLAKEIDFKIYPGLENMGGMASLDIALPDFSSAKKPNCTQSDFNLMFKGLLRPEAIDRHLFFIFSAIRRSHMDEEHFLAIVDLATAVETAFYFYHGMYSFLFDQIDNPTKNQANQETDLTKALEVFEKTGMHHTDPANKQSKIRKLDALRTRFDLIQGVSNNEIADTQDFKDWYENAWKLRHKIVHEGEMSVTKDQVEKALKLAQWVIREIGFDQETFKKVFDIAVGGKTT